MRRCSSCRPAGWPTSLGRRPVLSSSGACCTCCPAWSSRSPQDAGGFLLGVLLLGVGRALDSGPLEAWYVDAVHDGRPAAPTSRPACRGPAAADGGGARRRRGRRRRCCPALLGGSPRRAVPRSPPPPCSTWSSSPPCCWLVHRGRPPREGAVRPAALRAAPGEVPVDRRPAPSAWPSPTARCAGCCCSPRSAGPALVGVRAARAAALRRAGRRRPQGGARCYGVVLARRPSAPPPSARCPRPRCGGCLRRLDPRHLRRARRSSRPAASPPWPSPAPSCCPPRRRLAFYVAHGAPGRCCHAVLHGRVDAAHRATAVSAMSLAMALGGIARQPAPCRGVCPAPDAGVRRGRRSLVLARRACACGLPSGDEEALLDEPLDDGQHLLGGLGVGQPGAAGEHGQQVAEPAGARRSRRAASRRTRRPRLTSAARPPAAAPARRRTSRRRCAARPGAAARRRAAASRASQQVAARARPARRRTRRTSLAPRRRDRLRRRRRGAPAREPRRSARIAERDRLDPPLGEPVEPGVVQLVEAAALVGVAQPGGDVVLRRRPARAAPPSRRTPVPRTTTAPARRRPRPRRAASWRAARRCRPRRGARGSSATSRRHRSSPSQPASR